MAALLLVSLVFASFLQAVLHTKAGSDGKG